MINFPFPQTNLLSFLHFIRSSSIGDVVGGRSCNAAAVGSSGSGGGGGGTETSFEEKVISGLVVRAMGLFVS